MDETFAPDTAIDKAALKTLCQRSDAAGLRQLAGHGAGLAITGAAVAWAQGSVWLLPALLGHGVVLVFLFAPLHETIHRTAFASRRLNDAVAWVCGLVLLLPPEYFRAFHFAHHRHTQDPVRDPELATDKPATLRAYLLVISGLPYWRERVTTLLRHVAGRVAAPFIPARQQAAIGREARIVLSVYGAVAVASLATGSWAAVLYWLAPVLLGQPALRLFLLAEHTGCPLVPDMLRNSRTTQTTWLMRRLAWNMPYHAEHHAYPALPFHALRSAHGLLRDKIAAQAPGYITVHWEIVAGLGRKGNG
jgi:fatty acid desaturase